MSALPTLQQTLSQTGPVLALAPMQDVTTLPFMSLMAQHGGADLYVTEFFRVTPGSRLDRTILRSITENATGRPIVAQLIGDDRDDLARVAKELHKHPVAAIDLNLGCPAPVVYRKCAGGGLLRDLPRVDGLLGAMREAITLPFTIKTRVGFDQTDDFEKLLALFAKHSPDLVTVHGRTVLELYRPTVRYDLIQQAVATLPCPVLANGDVTSAERAATILKRTGARGLMIGRGAVRNPWLFDQIRQLQRGEPVSLPTGRDVQTYIEALYEAASDHEAPEIDQVHHLKKQLNFLGTGLPDSADFLHQMRRAQSKMELFEICRRFLDHDRPMTLEPTQAAAI